MWKRAALAPAVTAAMAEEIQLPIAGPGWTKKYFNIGSAPLDEAAGFAMPDDAEHGACLSVGPWRAGDFSIRFEYANRGLFQENGQPWTELQEALRAVHQANNARQ